jgi:hypothetical protein
MPSRATTTQSVFFFKSSHLSPLEQIITFSHPVKMKWLSLALALAVPSEAYIRFGCGTLSVQRLDPVVEVLLAKALIHSL